MFSKLKRSRPSPSMIVALVALVAALGGTAYAAGRINGNSIEKQSIGGGKIKQKTLTGYQINTNKLGKVPTAETAESANNIYWAVVHNPGGAGNATLAYASGDSIAVTEAAGSVNVIFPRNVAICAAVAGRNYAGSNVSMAGYAQTNANAANPNAIEIHTRNKDGAPEGADFHLIVAC